MLKILRYRCRVERRESGEELVWLPNKKEGSEVST